jgi:hypothetical protein
MCLSSKLPCLGWRSADFLQGFSLIGPAGPVQIITKISMTQTHSSMQTQVWHFFVIFVIFFQEHLTKINFPQIFNVNNSTWRN